MQYRLALISLGLVACGNDGSLKVQTAPPVVTIQQPTDGAELQQGEFLQLRGFIQDSAYEDDLTQLQASWSVGGTKVCEDSVVDLGGNTTCDHTFTASGDVLIELQAISPEATNTATSTVTIVPNLPPEAEIILPNGTGNYYSDHLISFDGVVSDVETAASDLFGYWTSSIDGELDISAVPDQDGHVRGEELLSQGTHTITFIAFESESRQSSDTITIEVGGDNQLPDCSITAPLPGETYSTGEVVEFAGQASDADIPSSELVAEWRSNIDGVLSETPVNSDSTFSTGISTLTDGPHTITLSVHDEVDGSCTSSVDIIISSRPSVTITAPSAGEVFNEGARIDFQAQVSDAQDQPQDLLLNWSSSLDGTFSTQAATSNGIAIANSYMLSAGSHVVELHVTDRDGYSSTDQVAVQVNALPTAPVISVVPTPVTSSDDMSINIDIPSVDPDSTTQVTYSYQWTKNTQPTNHTSATVPFTDTVRGEVWEVYVTPSDGQGNGNMVSAAVTIDNSAPFINSANLSLTSLLETDTISCSPAGEYDEDGDNLNFTYNWLVNGSSVSSSSSINGEFFSRGDTVQCQITPDDGYPNGTGPTVSSATLTVANSIPSYSGADLTPLESYEADTLTCQSLDPADSDGDTVTPIYSWKINGAVITPTTQTLTGEYFDKDDSVQCQVVPNDGTDTGSQKLSNIVIIQNTAPVLGVVNLTPLDSFEDSTLACTPENGSYTDDDNDPISFSYQWLVNDNPIANAELNTLSGADFDKADRLRCIATPQDGTDAGLPVESNEIVIQNTPPTIADATLSSPTNDVTADLTCTAGETNDIDPADSVSLSYAWTIGGTTVDGQNNATLSKGLIKKGDVIACIITPSDDESNGIPAVSNSITIENTAPEYSGADLTPVTAYEETILTCTELNPYDDDGDEVSPIYTWYVGDATAPLNVSTKTLDGTYFNKDDQVYCTVTPDDTFSVGTPKQSNVITIQNTPPELTIVDLTPLDSFENSTLACTPQIDAYSDDDGDSVSFFYTWIINNSSIGVDTSTIDGTHFNKGSTVSCKATPYDGTVNGVPIESNEIVIQNTPPTIAGATLSSLTNDVTADLTCTAGETDDIDPADSVSLSYAWTIGGTTVDGQNNATLSKDLIKKGDVIACIITPSDDESNGIPAVSNSITIENTAPEYSGADLAPTTAYEKTILTCTALNAFDADGDEVTPTYAWYVGSSTTPTPVNVSSETLGGDYFNKGDQVYCTATPNDGLSSGEPKQSNTVTIKNTPPALTIIDLTPVTSYEDSTLTCDPKDETDDDNDPISFSYDWVVDGSLIGVNASQIGGSHFNKNDTVFCKATPNDGTLNGAEVLSNEITIQNTPPTITGATLSSNTNDVTSALTCTAGTTGDIDPEDANNITVLYSWKKNGENIIGQTGSTLQPTHFAYEDEVTCLVTPTDGVDTGTTKTSNAITINNSIPSYTNPSLTPAQAYEESTLTCNLGNASDPDGQTVTPIYAWYRNNALLTGIVSSTLSGDYFNRGDSIYCSTTPNDGIVTGLEVASGSVTIQNTPPTANTPSITPTTATENTIFACSENGGADDDPSDTVSFSYGWKVNGQTTGQTGTTLTGDFFDKGDIVKCFVTPKDGTSNGTSVESIGVSIGNSAPTFDSISISPVDPETEESISSSATGWLDDDGDDEDYTYQWYNQDGQISGATGASLGASNTAKGDVVYLQATAFDGTALGVTRTSNAVTVVNTAPEAPVIEIQPTNAEPEDTLTCEIITDSYDADNDSITYSYQWYRNGAIQNSFTTNTVGSANTAHNDQWTCTATPYDGSDYGPAASDSQVIADTTDPNAPILDAIELYRHDGSVTINGSAEPSSFLQLYSNCSPSSQSVPPEFLVPISGAFSIVVNISSGSSCSYYARARDAAGNISSDSNTISTEYCDPIDEYEVSTVHDGNTCSNAIDVLAVLAPASSNASVETLSGNVITPGDEDWYVVDTSQDVGTSGVNYYNFQVELTTGSAEYDITVYRGSCAGTAIQIDPNGETSYDSYNFFAQDNSSASGHLTPSDSRYCQNNSLYNNCEDLSEVYYIKVHRVDGIVDCSEYTLSIQNGYPSSAPN